MKKLPEGLLPLAEYHQFIVWQLIPDTPKDRKVPINIATMDAHNPHDPAIWMDAQTAIDTANVLGDGYAVGFTFTEADPFWFLDIDGTTDSPLTGMFSSCAIEISQSGNGLHIFGTGDCPPHSMRNSENGLEFYTGLRFAALTGTMVGDGVADADCSLLLPWLVDTYFSYVAGADPGSWTSEPDPDWQGSDDDDILINKFCANVSATTAFGGKRTNEQLFTGNLEDEYDASSADASLAAGLAFWTGKDCDRIERLMRRSALVRPKWDRRERPPGYLKTTILKACAQCKDVYSSGGPPPPPTDLTGNPDPIDLELPSVDSFDPHLLPKPFRPWIIDSSQRMDGSSPDFMAVGVMVSVSSLIGRKVLIQPKKSDSWTVTPNLWGVCVGRPSAKKTPTLKEAMLPLMRFEAEARDHYALLMHSHEIQQAAHKVAVDSAKRKARDKDRVAAAEILSEAYEEEPTEPIRKRHVVNDTTIEKLGELLCENPNGLLLFRDELTGWLKSLSRDDRQQDRSFYLESWTGDGSFTYDRIGRGTIDIPNAIVSILGGIQPGRLAGYLHNRIQGEGDDGLIERFQLDVYPDFKKPTVMDLSPDKVAKESAYEAYRAIRDLHAGPVILRFDDTGQCVFDEWYAANLQRTYDSDDSHIESLLGKYSSLMPSLALIIHVVEHGATGRIGEDAAARACAWCTYLEGHARRIYAIAAHPLLPAQQLSEKLRELPNPFTIRDVCRQGWSGLKTREIVERAVKMLCEHSYIIQADEEPRPGPRTLKYIINPSVLAES